MAQFNHPPIAVPVHHLGSRWAQSRWTPRATGFDDDFDSSFDNDFFDNDFVLMLPNIAARFTYRNRQASYPTRW